MFHNCMKLSLALGALCLTGLIGTANAASPVPELRVAPIAIPVVDEGTAIEEEERPNEVTPGSESKDAAGARGGSAEIRQRRYRA